MASDPRILGRLGGQVFQEQADFFQQKVRLPTKKYTDLQRGEHTRAFVVAGATRDALLVDFQTAIDRAIKEGTGRYQFRQDFDRIVAAHGWAYNGSAGWRSRVIFETNLRTAYQAGRYKQLTDPGLKKLAPYWIYKHGDSKVPRPEHLAWDGLVLHCDDPWWKTHYPPNGWGCTCTVYSRTKGEIEREGLKVSEAPPVEMVERTVGSGADARTMEVPAGIDPGWDYNVGESAWGQQLTEKAWAEGQDGWEPRTPGNWESEGLPSQIPLEETLIPPADPMETKEDVETYLTRELGGESALIPFETEDFVYPVLANAKTLARHLDPGRAHALAWLKETISDPTEAWLSFEESRKTGKMALKVRFIKAHAVDKGKSVVVVANAKGGVLEAWTVIPTLQTGYINNQRRGKLLRKKTP